MKRVTVVVGHFGSGKTEFSINYSLDRGKRTDKSVLVDLDSVTPYFRSYEQREALLKKGVEVVGNPLSEGKKSSLFLPIFSSSVIKYLHSSQFYVTLDTGGDPIGVKILTVLKEHININESDIFCVINKNRPETENCELALSMIERLQNQSGMAITGIVNNTHLLNETKQEDVDRGVDFCRSVSQKSSIPLVYHFGEPRLLENIILKEGEQILPMTCNMRENLHIDPL